MSTRQARARTRATRSAAPADGALRAAPAAAGAAPASSAVPADGALRHRNLPLLLLQAREAVLARFRPILKAHGLTEQQWRVLRALVDGPLEPREIVEVCRISSPSLAGVLARMDDLGLVARVRMPHDARRLQVHLTPHSRALAAAMAPQIEATYAALEAELGGEFVAMLYGALDRLVSRLGPDTGDAGEAEGA